MFISSILPTLSHFLKLLLFIAFLRGTLLLFLYFQIVDADNAFVKSSIDFSEITIGPILSGIQSAADLTDDNGASLVLFIVVLLILYRMVGAMRRAEIKREMRR